MIPAAFIEWNLSTWNRRLFDAVFSVKGGVSLPIRRINVSPSFLASIAGVDEDGGDGVRDALLTRLQEGFPRGRGIFDRARVLWHWRRKEEIPPFFVNLYLSLIAASASEETHEEGNFRVRMALFLALPARVDPVTYDLPRLWEDLEDWSQSDLAAASGYRPLELPDPGNENLIGYAKRLAFPRFRDMSWLSRVITESGIDTGSPVSSILQTIGRGRSHFSGAFREEFDRFRALARSGDPGCMNTLFWDAFTEVTWETHPSRSRSSAQCRLGMEVPDVWNPQAVLLVPRGFDASSLPGRTTMLDDDAGHEQALIAKDGWSLLGSPDHPWRPTMPRRLETLIEAGCLPFGPGDAVHWDSRFTLPWSGPVWLVVSQRKVDGVRRALEDAGVTATPNPIRTAGGWYLLGRLDYRRESLRGIVQGLPSDLRRLLDPGVPDARIYLRDAIRLPDGILALRPRLPMMRAEGAEALRLTAIDDAISIDLRLGPDGLFTIPAEESRRLTAGDYRATAHVGGRIQARRVLHLIQTYAGADPPLPPSDPGRWLVEGARGQLAPLRDPDSVRGERIDAGLLVRGKASLPLGGTRITALWRPLADIPSEWADLFEVLVAWSSRREGFGWDEVEGLVRDGLGVEEWSAHQAIDVLVDNEIVDRFYDRRWRSSLFFTRRPTSRLVKLGMGWECRVSGPSSRMWRHRFIDVLNSYGLVAHVAVLGDRSGIGVMRVLGESRDDLEEVIGEMELDRGEPIELPEPDRLLSELVPESFSEGIDVAYLDPSRSAFTESPTDPSEGSGWRLERRKFETQQSAYVLSYGDRTMWISRSRRWGGFLAGWTGNMPFWEVGDGGVLTSRWPLPLALSRVALWHGGGVAGSGWHEGDRSWWYAFGSVERARDLLVAWMAQERDGSAQDPAMGVWLEALSEAPGAPPEESLWHWYGEAR